MNVVKGRALLGGSFFEEIGGAPCLGRVHRCLYDRLFAHPWLKGYFVRSKREIVESQQNDFWAGLMGGPNVYGGRSPKDAHHHMFVTAEAFAARHALLGEVLRDCGVPEPLRKRWLILDSQFERAIVKRSLAECRGRYRSEEVIVVPRP
ncbi:MAG: group 1 truncated hemoglobin [Kiloniellales bacterium]|nr:group 1 truncated hemoglobin [Kiloniellales bacterium]